MTKPRSRGDKQLRADDRFDRARAVGESAAALRNSNRSDYVLTAEDEAKIKRYETPPDRFAVTSAPSVINASECRAWAEAATS